MRNIVSDSAGPPTAYRVRTGLWWHVPFAKSPSDARVALLVDRIALDVHSYYPYGEDYQVILHCRLVNLARRRVVADFVIRGRTPGDRLGMPIFAGLFDRVGGEPWARVGDHVETLLAQREGK